MLVDPFRVPQSGTLTHMVGSTLGILLLWTL